MRTIVFACSRDRERSRLAAELFNALVEPALARAYSADAQQPPSPVDLVVTMGDGDRYRSHEWRRLDWPLLDPSFLPTTGEPLRERVARHVRDLIVRERWVRVAAPAPHGSPGELNLPR
jgi:hypothetical protein